MIGFIPTSSCMSSRRCFTAIWAIATADSRSESAITALAQEVAGLAPEDINEGADTAASKRIIRYLPIYEKTKVRIGAPAAAAIGLPTLRKLCLHFDEWVCKLEGLGAIGRLVLCYHPLVG